jgi:hypothetical protein
LRGGLRGRGRWGEGNDGFQSEFLDPDGVDYVSGVRDREMIFGDWIPGGRGRTERIGTERHAGHIASCQMG